MQRLNAAGGNQLTNRKQKRLTNQKMAVLEYLKSVKIHPSAETVYAEVKKALPRITLATVYRNLKELSKEGLIQEIPAKASRYDGDISSHAHFICEKCGQIFDVFSQCSLIKPPKTPPKAGPPRAEKVGKPGSRKISLPGTINKYQVYLYGNCNKCSKMP
jgi:Fe2+ or Zn2+ uptake regulation protein